MGAWSAAIKGNDTTIDIYDHFMERYASGVNATDISKEILEGFKEYFRGDDRHDALLGLALAQWETASLDPGVLGEVKTIVETGQDLARWRQLEASEADIKRREKALEKFLQQISVPRRKPKRRQGRRFDFKQVELVGAVAPDGKKVFRIAECFVNGEYDGTHGSMDWDRGGNGILTYRNPNKNITAHWRNSQALVVTHDKNIDFMYKHDRFAYCSDTGAIEYVPTDWPLQRTECPDA